MGLRALRVMGRESRRLGGGTVTGISGAAGYITGTCIEKALPCIACKDYQGSLDQIVNSYILPTVKFGVDNAEWITAILFASIAYDLYRRTLDR